MARHLSMSYPVIKEMDEVLQKELKKDTSLMNKICIWRDMLTSFSLLYESPRAMKLRDDLLYTAYKSASPYRNDRKIVKPDHVYTEEIHKEIMKKIILIFLEFCQTGENLTEDGLNGLTDKAFCLIRDELWKGYSENTEEFYDMEVDGTSWGCGIYDIISEYCMGLAAHVLQIRHDEGILY